MSSSCERAQPSSTPSIEGESIDGSPQCASGLTVEQHTTTRQARTWNRHEHLTPGNQLSAGVLPASSPRPFASLRQSPACHISQRGQCRIPTASCAAGEVICRRTLPGTARGVRTVIELSAGVRMSSSGAMRMPPIVLGAVPLCGSAFLTEAGTSCRATLSATDTPWQGMVGIDRHAAWREQALARTRTEGISCAL
jgi:hypothetical protein